MVVPHHTHFTCRHHFSLPVRSSNMLYVVSCCVLFLCCCPSQLLSHKNKILTVILVVQVHSTPTKVWTTSTRYYIIPVQHDPYRYVLHVVDLVLPLCCHVREGSARRADKENSRSHLSRVIALRCSSASSSSSASRARSCSACCALGAPGYCFGFGERNYTRHSLQPQNLSGHEIMARM